jgi:hypothetical protein
MYRPVQDGLDHVKPANLFLPVSEKFHGARHSQLFSI